MSEPLEFPPISKIRNFYHLTYFKARKEIFNNYIIFSNFVRTIVKADSTTDQEFEIKYGVFEKMMAKHTLYGRLSLIGSMGLLMTYFFKGNSAKIKVFSGFLFLLWQPHIYTLGSHLGVYMNLKWAVDELLVLEKSDTAKLTKKFINKLRERDYARDKGNATQCDSVLMEEFYKDLIGKEGKIIFKNHSYVKNRYFLDNKEKYSEKNPENNPVIFQNQDLSTEDRLKLPIFDCFVSRYVYHTFTRWLIRFGQYLRVVKDE